MPENKTLTVQELIEALKKFDPDRSVVLDVNAEQINSDRTILKVISVEDCHPETSLVFLQGDSPVRHGVDYVNAPDEEEMCDDPDRIRNHVLGSDMGSCHTCAMTQEPPTEEVLDA